MLSLDTADKAIESLRNALRLDPYFIDGWHNLGKVYGWQGRFDLAIVCYERALEITPGDPALHYGLGFVYADSGNVKEAVAEWERTLKLNPEHKEARRKIELIKKVVSEKENLSSK
jgi:cytochrome c-type biogenesis protein CcmH/NrfG